MSAFTPEQQEILGSLMKSTLIWPSILNENVNEIATRIAALQALMIQKGFITPEELDYAYKEANVMVEVEKALSPELDELEEELKRIIRGEVQEGDD